MTPARSQARHGAAINLVNDHLTGALVDGLRRRGLRPIVLKGASVRRLLYGSSDERTSNDIDLLVSPTELPPVEAALPSLHWRYIGVTALGAGRDYRTTWMHEPTGIPLEIHTSLVGIGAPPVAVWRVLTARTESMEIGGTAVEVLDTPARAFHVAIHAAQHGRAGVTTIGDLERALAHVSSGVWREAAELAARLDAIPAFAGGLGLAPRGQTLLRELAIEASSTPDVALRLETAPPLSQGLVWLSQLPSTGARVRFVARTLLPPPGYLRVWSPMARRGTVGLIMAYCWRPFWMLRHVVPAMRAWRNATRGLGEARPRARRAGR